VLALQDELEAAAQRLTDFEDGAAQMLF